MSKDNFPQSNGSGILNYILDVYGAEVPKIVFDHLGCSMFYEKLLIEGRIRKVSDGCDPLVKIERSYENFEYYNCQIR